MPPSTHDAAQQLEHELRARAGQGKLELPILPEAAQAVMLATSREDTDAKALSELVRKDAAFAAHLLRLANSAAYAPRSPLVSLQQAVSRLGQRTIREIALIISCKTRAFQVKGHEVEVRALFKHSLAAGLFAQEVARLRRLNVEDAFLGGLLHDVGRPALIQAAIDTSAELGLPTPTQGDLDTLSDALHEELAETLIRAWGLSPKLAGAIRHHHHPAEAGDLAASASLLQLADDIAHHLMPLREVTLDALHTHPALSVVNLYPEDLDALLARGPEILAQVEALQ